MKLYYKPGSCSLFPHIILHETKTRFTLEKVDLRTKKTEQDRDYLLINRKGLVPALELDDGSILTETVAIALYLADKAPQYNLIAPPNTIHHYHAIEWLNYIATELHKSFSPLFRPGTPESYKDLLRSYLEQRFRYINEVLSEHDCLVGNRFGVADAYLYTITRWAQALKFDLTHFPALKAYLERIEVRPSVEKALTAEGLLLL
ncbi:glutathione transferase GstA [Pectobacteriaceae bacterium CE90]|nr:glutathione transferase GstA [Prodigiosinella sp. LS101]WJV52027.1 glutathione transferase GstA [Prodigiosinella sp. LS101]WJV56384.1 glutathione transferase GstA [Pectobacteriaceae bacterium C111]WJY16781.1 glutathione transferase GstA [Pectobacteriaceae bacterium CE90]